MCVYVHLIFRYSDYFYFSINVKTYIYIQNTDPLIITNCFVSMYRQFNLIAIYLPVDSNCHN